MAMAAGPAQECGVESQCRTKPVPKAGSKSRRKPATRLATRLAIEASDESKRGRRKRVRIEGQRGRREEVRSKASDETNDEGSD